MLASSRVLTLQSGLGAAGRANVADAGPCSQSAIHKAKFLKSAWLGFDRRLASQMPALQASSDKSETHTGPTDAAEGGVAQYIGNLCFRSQGATYLWNTSLSAPYRIVRVAAMNLISLLLLARAWRLFVRPSPEAALLLVAVSAVSWQFGVTTAIGIVLAALILTLAKQLASTPEVNSGHRAGGKGFAGEHIENTLEALTALIQKDNATPEGLNTLAYIEFDVHETGDGELVVLHDLYSVLAASSPHVINQDIMAELAGAGLLAEAPPTTTRAKLVAKAQEAGRGLYGDTAGLLSLTAAQLKQVHISGRQGVHVPTLGEFLRCCTEQQLQRSVAVEVKSIATDAGRTKFVQLLSNYKRDFERQQDPQMNGRMCAPFAPIAAISFPFFWAPAFGEFGSSTWQKWAAEFAKAGVRTRCCVWHALDLTRGS